MREEHDPNSPAYTNAILEDIEGKFQIILEATQPIPDIQAKLDATFEEVGKLRVDVDALQRSFAAVEKRLDIIEQAMKLIERNTTDIDELKSHVRELELALKPH